MTGRLGEHVEAWSSTRCDCPMNVMPWFALWAAALGRGLPRRGGSVRPGVLPAYGLRLEPGACSLSEAKREVYLLPVLPLTSNT